MTRVSAVDQRLATGVAHRQVETLVRLERTAAGVERVFDQARRDLLQVITDGSGPGDRLQQYTGVMLGAVSGSKETIHKSYRQLVDWSHRSAVDVLLGSIPRDALATLLPEQAEFEWVTPAKSGTLFYGNGELRITEDAGPFGVPDELIKRKLTAAEKEEAFRQIIFPPPSLRDVAQIVARGFGEVSWEERLDSLSGLINNKKLAFSEITQAYSEGEGITQIRRRLEPLVGGVKASAQRIARTEGMRIAERMQRRAWDGLGDMFVGAQIIAVLDERTRPEHAQRSGTIYYGNPKGNQKSLAEMPDVPDAPNCRCMSSPVLSPPDELADDPEIRDEFKATKGAATGEPFAYDKWFKSADVGRRKIVVGVTRYADVVARLSGSREPEWSDFVDEDGNLLTIAQLQGETSVERQSRKARIKKQIAERAKTRRDISLRGFQWPAAKRSTKPKPRGAKSTDGMDFIRSKAARAGGEKLVEVDVDKLDAAWSLDLGYISASGDGVIGDRLDNAKAFIQTGEPLEASQVRIRGNGAIAFADGRHRFAAMRELGKRKIFVTVPRSQAAEVEKLLG